MHETTDNRASALPERCEPPGRATLQPECYGEYDAHGVHVSLIRYMLGKIPLERFVFMEQHARHKLLLEYG